MALLYPPGETPRVITVTLSSKEVDTLYEIITLNPGHVVTFQLFPNSIGMTKHVITNGKQEDITDYDLW